jgi:hypothetical protein
MRARIIVLFAIMASLAVASPVHPAAVERKHVRTAFQYTLREGPSFDPLQQLVITGTMDIDLDPADGTFAGTITPGVDADTLQPLPGVLFHALPGGLQPASAPAMLRVRGQISGHAANIVVLDVGGPGKHVYATGSTEFDAGKGYSRDPGRVLGWAVGPDAGDAGNWGATLKVTVKVCFENGGCYSLIVTITTK